PRSASPCPSAFPYTTLFRSVRFLVQLAWQTRRLVIYLALYAQSRSDSQFCVWFGWFNGGGSSLPAVDTLGFLSPARIRPNCLRRDRESTRLNSSHSQISYAV